MTSKNTGKSAIFGATPSRPAAERAGEQGPLSFVVHKHRPPTSISTSAWSLTAC